MEDEDKTRMNVRISNIIFEELNKYLITNELTYIILLGKMKSTLTGFDCNDFVIMKNYG